MRKLTQVLFTMACSMVLVTGCAQNGNKAQENSGNNSNVIEENKNIDLTTDEIYEVIKTAYGENYLPNMPIEGEFLELEFGLTSDMYEEVKAEQPMISVHVDKVVVVKAKEGKADDVEAALNTARENKIKDTLQYPMNLPKINAAKVVRNGDYLCFLLVGAINDNVDATEEEAKQFAEDEVEKGVKAFNDLFK